MLTGPELIPVDEVPIGVGAFEAARQDLKEQLHNDPELIEKWFAEFSKTDRELAMSILKSARAAAENHQPADEIYIESTFILFSALKRTRQALELDAILDDVA